MVLLDFFRKEAQKSSNTKKISFGDMITSRLNYGASEVKIPVEIRMLEKYGKDIFKCPCCASGQLQIVASHRYFETKTNVYKTLKNLRERNKASPAKVE